MPLPPVQDEKHGRFLLRLKNSSPALFAVARYLHEKDFTVLIPRKRYTPSVEEHENYVDNGDIDICKDGNWERVEVKGINTQFTCLEDWPHKVMLVSNKKAVDRANPLPRAYFIVSKDLVHCAVIRGDTKHLWFETVTRPKTTGVNETFYAVANDVPSFIKLNEV